MRKQRVLLICSQHLFGESVETILRAANDVELIGPWEINQDISERLLTEYPDVVVIADEGHHNDAISILIATIIEHYPGLSVIRTDLNENNIHVFSIHTLPARGKDLLASIRKFPPENFPLTTNEKK